MLQEKLIRMCKHHLSESKAWNAISRECEAKKDSFGRLYAIRKELAHHDMCVYFLDLAKSVHYVHGTWREVCGQRK